jgi:hypothetical protein
LLTKVLALALLVDQRGADVTLTGAAKAWFEGLATLVPRLQPPEREVPHRLQAPGIGPSPARFKELGKPNGFLVAPLAYGLYLGRPLPRRGQLFTFGVERDQVRIATKRGNAKLPGGCLGLQGTLYFTPQTGLTVETRVGNGWFAGLSLVHRW